MRKFPQPSLSFIFFHFQISVTDIYIYIYIYTPTVREGLKILLIVLSLITPTGQSRVQSNMGPRTPARFQINLQHLCKARMPLIQTSPQRLALVWVMWNFLRVCERKSACWLSQKRLSRDIAKPSTAAMNYFRNLLGKWRGNAVILSLNGRRHKHKNSYN